MSLDKTRLTNDIFFKLEANPNFNQDISGSAEASILKHFISSIVDAIIDEFVGNAVVNSTLDASLNTIFVGGIPVLTDGGAALQTAWIASTTAGAKDDSTGGIT